MEMDRIQKTTTRSAAPTTEAVTTMSSNATTVTVDKTEYDAIVMRHIIQEMEVEIEQSHHISQD